MLTPRRSSLSLTQRKAYTDAVVCLQNKPSKLNPAVYPGAKTRYDDFLATHINYTLTIHLDAIFLSWHRNFVHLYEAALQNECGYSGTQPYWNWPLYVNDLQTSTLFDGSEYSMSGDGTPIPNEANITVGPNATLPHGSGGGCVTTGPFKNHTAPMGPFDFALVFTSGGVLPADSFAYTPECFGRDLNSYVAQTYTNQSDVDELLATTNIADFQNTLSGPLGTLDLGAHAGGHFTMGANGSDFFASPTDPAFYLHHAQIDRLWAEWQANDPINRQYALSGTKTTANIPPSANLTLIDQEYWGNLDSPRYVVELMSISAGPYCYRYE